MPKMPKGFGKFDNLMKKLVRVDSAEQPEILLRCPSCGKTLKQKRDPTDPPSAVIMETQCPRCVGSGFSFVEYFDALGNPVDQK
jgi:hypothetical protein